MDTIITPTVAVKDYLKVIAGFKKRADVQSGEALGYRKNQDPNGELLFKNKPKSIGDGLSTTGWCVSASQAFLLDPIFNILLQDRGSRAKLVSIDIKEQFYGNTYSGHKNKWHTAVLVSDKIAGDFIIDLTCSQFGNNYVGKDVWDFKTWELTFRSPNDKHIITDFEQNVISYLPKQKDIPLSELQLIDVQRKLHDITTITDNEKQMLSEFFLEKINIINTKLLLNNINKFDFSYLETINSLLKHLDFVKLNKSGYCVLTFNNKENAKAWIAKFLNNDKISEQYLMFSSSISEFCKFNQLNDKDINIESMKSTHFIVIEIENIKGVDISFLPRMDILIPYGIKFEIAEGNIFNGGKLIGKDNIGLEKKTNTIYIKATL